MHPSPKLLAGVLAASLVVAACGGDDDTVDSTTPTVTTEPAPATTAAAPTTTPPATQAPATTEPAAPLGSGSMAPEDAVAVDAAATAALASSSANGATAFYVAIDDPELGDYVAAYGTASVDGPAATVDDNFRIGSITKSFTSTVVLQLVEEGALSLDDTVADVLPDRAVDYPDLADITVEELLGMTSGVADYFNVPDSVIVDIVEDPMRVWGTEELIAIGIDAGVEPPGTPGYSTTNYLVLQLMAESLTGEPLEDLIAERVTGPLGLDHLFLPPVDNTDLPEPATSGYVAGGCVTELANDGATVAEGTDTTDWNASYGQGGGGMTSNISDLLAWSATMSGNELLGDDTVAGRMELTDIGGLAYGWGILRVGAWFGHEGEAIGWESFALHDPETGVSVAMAVNGCGGLIADFATFLDTLYPDGDVFGALLGGPDPSWLTGDEPADGDDTDDVTGEPEVPAGDADGVATFRSGDVTIEGDVVACTLDGNDVTMNVNAENAGIEVLPLGDGEVSVDISGALDWIGVGDATVDGGSVSIVGTGSLDEPGAPIDDFTLDAEIGAC